MKQLQKKALTVAGVRSPYLESGPGEAEEAVVFVHGNPGSAQDWENLLLQVGHYGRAVALDMPGFGQADKPDNFDYTVPGYARHLAGTLRALGIQRVHLVLHDFGGLWGLTWAVENPDQFASVTLINVGIMPGYRWHYAARIWRTPLLGELFMAMANRRAFHLLQQHGTPCGLPLTFVNRMYDDYDWGTRRAVLRLYRATDASDVGEALARRLPRPSRPALVVWGIHDPFAPVRYAEQQREFFPDARIVTLLQSGHWPFADDPTVVADTVVPFLRQLLKTSQVVHYRAFYKNEGDTNATKNRPESHCHWQ